MGQVWVTRREREVMRLVAGGRTTAEIARRLGITVNTVESHVRSVRTKLGAPTRTAAVAWLPAPSAGPDRGRADGVVAAAVAGGVALDAGVLDQVVAGRPDGPAAGVTLDPAGEALLSALAGGLPLTAAARVEHMSLRTAHRRLSDARDALGAATTAEAVARWCAAAATAAAGTGRELAVGA